MLITPILQRGELRLRGAPSHVQEGGKKGRWLWPSLSVYNELREYPPSECLPHPLPPTW